MCIPTFGSSPNKSLTTAITRSDFSNTFCSYVYVHEHQWVIWYSPLPYGRRLTVNDFITSFSCTFPLVFPMALLLWLLAAVKCLTSMNNIHVPHRVIQCHTKICCIHGYAHNIHVHACTPNSQGTKWYIRLIYLLQFLQVPFWPSLHFLTEYESDAIPIMIHK